MSVRGCADRIQQGASAVDGHDLARDEPGPFGAQELHRLGKLSGSRDPAKWRVFLDLFAVIAILPQRILEAC